jgi:cytochrome c
LRVRDAHGNISDQNRFTKLPGASGEGLAYAKDTHANAPKEAAALFKNENCSACHAPNAKLVGPSIADISTYKDQSGAVDKLMAKVKNGGAGVCGSILMPPQAQLSSADRKALVEWVLSGGK